jgi:predicted nucleotidyltransferase
VYRPDQSRRYNRRQSLISEEKSFMKALSDLQLPRQLWSALQETKRQISAEFAVDRIVLFGSVVRGEADEESDVDLLIVLRQPSNHLVRNQISRLLVDINLEYDTNLSGLVVEQTAWDAGLLTVLPIRVEIQEKGIQL